MNYSKIIFLFFACYLVNPCLGNDIANTAADDVLPLEIQTFVDASFEKVKSDNKLCNTAGKKIENVLISGAKFLGKAVINNPCLTYAIWNIKKTIKEIEDTYPLITVETLRANHQERNGNNPFNQEEAEEQHHQLLGIRSLALAESFVNPIVLDSFWQSIDKFESWYAIISNSPETPYKDHIKLAGQLFVKNLVDDPFFKFIGYNWLLNRQLSQSVFTKCVIANYFWKSFEQYGLRKKIVSLVGANYKTLELEKITKAALEKEKKQISIKEKIKNIGKSIVCMFIPNPIYSLSLIKIGANISDKFLWEKARDVIAKQELLEQLSSPNGTTSDFFESVRSRVNHQQRLPILFALARYRSVDKKYEAAFQELRSKLEKSGGYKKDVPEGEACSVCTQEDNNGKIVKSCCNNTKCRNHLCIDCFKLMIDISPNKNCPFCKEPLLSWQGLLHQATH